MGVKRSEVAGKHLDVRKVTPLLLGASLSELRMSRARLSAVSCCSPQLRCRARSFGMRLPIIIRAKPGQYTWKMIQALPGKHALRPYRSLTSDRTAILVQARIGHCRLNQYLSRIGVVDEAKCSCGNDVETIRHLVLSCPRWTEERRGLRESFSIRVLSRSIHRIYLPERLCSHYIRQR
jgi:hypothetical protein